MSEPRGPIKCLQEAINTFVDRGRVYDGESGRAYEKFGTIMMAFFPQGIVLDDAETWNRYSLFHMEVAKLARYAANFNEGHVDSQHDIIVYAAMLESLDLAIQERKQIEVDKQLDPEAWIR